MSAAERVFIFRALPNGTDPTNANFENVAPFFLNETFPDEWFRRSTPYSLVNTGTDIVNLLLSSSELTLPGSNQGLNNFVPLGLDIGSLSPASATCLLASTILDNTPGQLSPAVVASFQVVEAFLNGTL